MHKLHDRFNYLRRMEAAGAILLPILFVWHWNKAPDAVHWPLGIAAVLSVSYLLVQGAIYWQLKHCALTDASALPAYFFRLFSAFKRSNVLLLGAVGVAFAMALQASGWRAQLAWPLAIYLFAVLEHINYYHYQLMYDTGNAVRFVVRNRRLRKAALGIDLQRAGGHTPAVA